MKKLSIQDLRDIVVGSTFLGSGGGGSPESGMMIVNLIAKAAKEVTLVEPIEVADNQFVAMIAGMGSPAAFKERKFGPEGYTDVLYAFDKLQRLYDWAGTRFEHIMPCETGGGNTVTPIYVAAVRSLDVVDADGTGGRSVPELGTTLYYLYGVPTSPIVLADKNGNIVVGWTKNPFDARMAEEIGRHVTVAFGMSAGLGTWVATGHQVKTCLEPGVIWKSREIGRALREAKEQAKDPVAETLNIANGHELIRGEITDIETKTVAGFDFGKTTIEGIGAYQGKKLIVDFKNENMIAWTAQNEPICMVPDSICLISLEGSPLTNADINKGMRIAAIGVPASEKWTKHPNGFGVWRHILEKLGYKGDFIPLKK